MHSIIYFIFQSKDFLFNIIKLINIIIIILLILSPSSRVSLPKMNPTNYFIFQSENFLIEYYQVGTRLAVNNDIIVSPDHILFRYLM